MAPAFVNTPASVASRSTFRGAALPVCAPTSNAAVSMSAAPISRRQALLAGAALLAGTPLAALAKGGDAPSISIFGVGGASSPFTAGVQSGGKVLYSRFRDDEIAVFKRIFSESKERIEGASETVKNKSWMDARSRIRLEASDLRKVQNSVNDSIEDKKTSEAAKKLTANIKLKLEQFDQACVDKSQDKAAKLLKLVTKDLASWEEVVGFKA